jgi:hypothetical protein
MVVGRRLAGSMANQGHPFVAYRHYLLGLGVEQGAAGKIAFVIQTSERDVALLRLLSVQHRQGDSKSMPSCWIE